MSSLSAKKTEQLLLKKVPIWLMVILSFLTLGFYMGLWLLNRKEDIKEIKLIHHIPFLWWRIVTFLLILFFFLNIFNNFIFSEFGYLYIESLDTIFTFFFLGLLYYTTYRLREVIEEVSTITYNKYLLFFFHIFYIQYKVNRNIVEYRKQSPIIEL